MGATIVDEFTVPRAKAAGATSFPGKLTLSLGALRRTLASAAVSPWKWMAITCLFLAISGGIRWLRDLQFEGNSARSKECPFPLNELPKDLGGWRMIDGEEGKLTPETAQVARASADIGRVYMNEKSGERVSVLIVYGLASSVFGHNAETCYPAAGWASNPPTTNHELTLPGPAKTAHYRECYFSRRPGSVQELIEVVYSFRHDGEWLPDASSHWKKFRSVPGMFKIQIQRVVREKADETSPSVALLGEFMQEFERRLAQVPATTALSTSASQGKPDQALASSAEPAKAD